MSNTYDDIDREIESQNREADALAVEEEVDRPCEFCRWDADLECHCGSLCCEDCRVGKDCLQCFFDDAEPMTPVVVYSKNGPSWRVEYFLDEKTKQEIDCRDRVSAYLLAARVLTGVRCGELGMAEAAVKLWLGSNQSAGGEKLLKEIIVTQEVVARNMVRSPEDSLAFRRVG